MVGRCGLVGVGWCGVGWDGVLKLILKENVKDLRMELRQFEHNWLVQFDFSVGLLI